MEKHSKETGKMISLRIKVFLKMQIMNYLKRSYTKMELLKNKFFIYYILFNLDIFMLLFFCSSANSNKKYKESIYSDLFFINIYFI